MSKIIEDMIRKSREAAEKEVLLEILKSGNRSVADIAYVEDISEEEVVKICEENGIPVPQCEDVFNIPRTPAQAEALLRNVMNATFDQPTIEYYAAKALKSGLLDKETVAGICMLSKKKINELADHADQKIKGLRHARKYYDTSEEFAEDSQFVWYSTDDYDVDWKSVPVDTWVEDRRFLKYDTGSDSRTRYHFAGVDYDGTPLVYSIGTSWTNGRYGSRMAVEAKYLYLVKREDFEKYAKPRHPFDNMREVTDCSQTAGRTVRERPKNQQQSSYQKWDLYDQEKITRMMLRDEYWNTKTEHVVKLMKNLNFSFEQATDALGISKVDYHKIEIRLKYYES